MTLANLRECCRLYQRRENTDRAPTMSEALDRFYAETDNLQRMHRHGAGIRKILQNNIERCNKKIAFV